jgi:hypothetical protein
MVSEPIDEKLKLRRHGLAIFAQNPKELLAGRFCVASGKESVGGASLTGASRPPDSMHVVFAAAWHIVVDDIHDVLDVCNNHRGQFGNFQSRVLSFLILACEA